jgi:ergothioneine biosynthesis protein EgtB
MASTPRASIDVPRAVGQSTASFQTASVLAERFTAVRSLTDSLCDSLETEDYVVQSMPDVSPTKWHLAHTSWFFETFILRPNLAGYRPLNAAYAFLFNSYYVHAGERHCRAQRGYISRPTVAEVFAYRRHVDRQMLDLLAGIDEVRLAALGPVIELGLNHEQQHQELMLTDIKHVFSVNPLRPAYHELSEDDRPADALVQAADDGSLRWSEHRGGLVQIGHAGAGFAYDNEGPRHDVFVQPFALADRPVRNADYLAFIEDGGYRRAELWLSMGWSHVQEHGWTAPFYWEQRDGRWCSYTLAGMRDIDPDEPVVHLSYYEADAFARWADARLPTEAEWETAAAGTPISGNFVESRRFHPRRTSATVPKAVVTSDGAQAASPGWLFGDVWEWTRSQYSAYPGYRPAEGALGEYNGKFMCNQFVLRGGSCATSRNHIRRTYRNFFPPEATWQFTGMRLARDL